MYCIWPSQPSTRPNKVPNQLYVDSLSRNGHDPYQSHQDDTLLTTR